MQRVRHIWSIWTAKVIGWPSSRRPPRPQSQSAPALHTGSSNFVPFAPRPAQSSPLVSLARYDRSDGRSTLLPRWQCGRRVSSGKIDACQGTESRNLMPSHDGEKACMDEQGAPAPSVDKAPSVVNREEIVAVGIRGGVGVGLPHQVSELYAGMERTLMSKMHAQDKNRFRAVGLSGVLLLMAMEKYTRSHALPTHDAALDVWVLSMFGSEIRRYFASQTAEVARETLKVEALQVQTQELATALVQTLLNDQEVVRAGALFLREASTNPETQAAVASLALYVLQHPDSLGESQVLAKKLVKAVLDNPETVEQVTDMAVQIMANPRFRQGVSKLVIALGESDEVFTAASQVSSRVFQDPDVQGTLSALLTASSHKVLQDEQVFDHSKEFVAQVVGDDALQRTGGDALWSTIRHALQTRIMKVAGFGLLAASVLMLSGIGGRGREKAGGRKY